MISQEYKAELESTNGKLWVGTRAWHKCRFDILDLIDRLDIESVLDFGAAEGTLGAWLLEQRPDLEVWAYEPRRPEWAEMPPVPVDLVVSTDVLEHVEPELVEATLEQIADIATKAQYHCISCRKAGARLPSGRNAHLTVNPPEWWAKQLTRQGWVVTGKNQYHTVVELTLEQANDSTEGTEGAPDSAA